MPYMDTTRAMHYNLNVPYICTRYVSFTPSQRSKFVNHNGVKMADVWNFNKLTEARTKMEVGKKLRTRVTQRLGLCHQTKWGRM